MFVQNKGSMTKEVTLTSKDTGWIHKDTKDLILALIDTATHTVNFSDTTSGTYYFDHSKVPVVFKSIYEGADWYTVDIHLVEV